MWDVHWPSGERVTGWIGELSPRVSILATSTSMPLVMGHFRCPPGDPAWRQVNCIGDAAHVVFPRTAVEITPSGTAPLAADANRVILYDAGQEYRRAPLDPRGDDCLFVALGDEAVEELGRDGTVMDLHRRRFRVRERHCPASAYVTLQLLRVGLTAGDHLAVDEGLASVLAEVLGDPGPEPDTDQGQPLAEAVRGVLARRYTEPLALVDVAAAVGVSPYHLHRRFRAATGWTIHGYRDHLRLREGLARVLDGEQDLSALAFELGYASHSHFTARFRRAFGVTPSSARRGQAVGQRKIVTVAARAAS